MQRSVGITTLVLLVIMGLFSSTAFASLHMPVPFGTEVTPLADDALDEVDGAWATYLGKTAVGAAVGTVTYLITTPMDDWNWNDGLRHTVAGAVSGFAGSLF